MKTTSIVLPLLFLVLGCATPKKEDTPPPKDLEKIVFRGTILGPGNEKILGASIEINGVTTNSESAAFEIPVDSATRYVLNIRKIGYGLLSKVFESPPSPDRKYRMTRGTLKAFDPNQDIDLIDTNTSSAQGSELQNVDWEGNSFHSVPLVLDKQGRLVDFGFRSPAIRTAFQEITSGPVVNPGARIWIPGGSLVGPDNTRPTGKVQVSLTTVDLYSEDGMPGDYSFVNRESNTRGFMQSTGAAAIEIYSEDGRTKYNLDPNSKKKARLTIPVDPLQLRLAKLKSANPLPEKISILSYNATDGVWEHSHEAMLNKKAMAYEAEVSHFSEYNMDVEKVSPACVKFKQQSGFPTTYRVSSLDYSGAIRYTTTNTAGQIVEPGSCNVAGLFGDHMLYNLPSLATAPTTELTELCIVFYRPGDVDPTPDPLAIYVMDFNDPYPPTPTCANGYAGCYSMPTIAVGDNLLVAAKYDAAGGGGVMKWIYNGTPTSWTYTINKRQADGTDVVLATVIGDNVLMSTEDAKVPSDHKTYRFSGVASDEFVWVNVVSTPGNPAPGIDSNKTPR